MQRRASCRNHLLGKACADLITTWLQQQSTRERPDTLAQLESSFATSRTLARTGRTIHFLQEARGMRLNPAIQHLLDQQFLKPGILPPQSPPIVSPRRPPCRCTALCSYITITLLLKFRGYGRGRPPSRQPPAPSALQ